MIIGHIMGIPVEESVLPLVPAGAATVTVIVYMGRTKLTGLLPRRRRR